MMSAPTIAIQKRPDKAFLYSATGDLLPGKPYKHAKIERMIRDGRASWIIKGVSAKLRHQADWECAKERIEWHTVSGDRKWDDSMHPTDPHGAKAIARGHAERKAREVNAPGCHSHSEWLEVLAAHGNRCVRCEIRAEDTRYGKLTKDHVVPLILGGTDYASNLQPLCGHCNSWKGGREMDFRGSPKMF